MYLLVLHSVAFEVEVDSHWVLYWAVALRRLITFEKRKRVMFEKRKRCEEVATIKRREIKNGL